MSYLTGQQIEQYQVEALLGEGGMGVVYQAVDLSRQRQVALKVMHANLAQQPAFRRRFEQEAEAVMPFNHPAIIKVFQLGTRTDGDSDVPFMVMEHIAGGSLSAYLQQLQWSGNQMPLQEALTIVAQIAEGLSYAHHRGLVHRDIKPGNILLKRERGFSGEIEQAVISDFGLAIVIPSGGSGEDVATNPFMGSLPYMSPEQCSNLPLDGRSDIYALGIMLYRMATGQLPFKIEAPADVVKHLNEPPLPPALLNPDIPEAVETLILKAIAKEPAERYQSGAEMAHAARQAVNAVRASSNGENRPAHPVTQWVDEQWIARINVGDRVDVHQTWTSEGEHRLFVTHQWEPSQVFSLDKETITIGRGADNDVMLEDGAVSNHHLTLMRTEQGGWLVRDLGSTNGSFLDGHRLPYDEEVIWNHEQTLRIGPYFLKWQAFQSHVRQAAGVTPLPFAGEGPNDHPRPIGSETAARGAALDQEADGASDTVQENGQQQTNGNGHLLAAGAAAVPPPQINGGNGGNGATPPIDHTPPPAAPQAVTEGDGTLGLALTPGGVEVEPGGEAYAQLTILNQGTTVEDISVRVEQRGQPSAWITVIEPAIKLMPDESKAVTLFISPPLGGNGHNAAPPEAGMHPYNVVVSTSRGERAVIAGTVEVARWESTVLDMHPRNLQEGIACRLTVQNRSNFANRYQLMGIDDGDALQFNFEQPQNVLRTDEENGLLWITVPVGGEARIPFKVGAKKRPWLRQPTTPYPFQVRVRSESTDWSNMEGQLSVRPRISRRSLFAILLILLFLSLLGFLVVRELEARNQEEIQRVQATSDAIRATADSLEATRVALQSGVDSKILEAEALEATAQAIEAEDPEEAQNIRATASAMREEAGAVQATIDALQGDLDRTEAELTAAQEAANVTPTPPPPPTDITLDNMTVPEDGGIGATVGSFSAATGSGGGGGGGTDDTVGQSSDARFAILGKGRSAVPAQQSGPRITYSLAAGDGDDDNDAFYIEDSELKVGVALDYETKNSYSVRVQADNGAGGTFAKPFTITVIDVNDTPTLTIRNVTVDEGDGNVVITVEMSGDTQSEVTVDYETSDGSARAGRDYEETEGTLTWEPEQTGPQTFEVPLIDDDLDELDEETFQVILSNPEIAMINSGSATVTIVDDDDEPTLSVTDISVEEGEEATVTVALDGLSSQEVVVDYQTADGTAEDGEDYDSATGTLRWDAGEDGELTFTVSTEDDDIHEADETIKVTLTGARNARIEQGTANITVTDNDEPPTLAIEDVGPVQEGGEAALTVMMTGRSAAEVTVKYATSDGSARSGTDYQATTGTLTWAPGESGARFVRITIHSDQIYEAPDETFKVTISNPVNATITEDEATFTITDDDQKPALSIVDASVNEGDGTVTVIVRMTGASSTPVNVEYTSGDGTATAGDDYEPASSPPALTWLPEDNSDHEIQVNIRDDDIDEGTSEQFEISLSLNGDNATLADGIAVITIVDDDQAGFSATPASLTVGEGEEEEVFTLRLLSQPLGEVVVPFSVNGQCFIGSEGSSTGEARLNESNWKSGVNVSVFARDDDIDDGDRSCNLQPGDPTSDDPQYDEMDANDIPDITLTAIDDDTAGIEIIPTTLEISEPDDVISFTVDLTSEPLDTVTIPLSSSDTGECTVQASVEIAPDDWNVGKAVEVRAVDDFIDDDDQSCTIITGDPQSSNDALYNAFSGSDVDDIVVTVRDDDQAGVIISPPTLAISETAGARQATISMTLTSQPVASVTIPISDQGSSQCDVSPASVTFTPEQWNEVRQATVTAVDDWLNDDDQPCDIELGPVLAAGDTKYNSMTLSDVAVTVFDDDEPGIRLTQSNDSTIVGEDGSEDEYSIVLDTEPAYDVEVMVNPGPRLDVGTGAGQPISVTFTALDWRIPVTLTVSALDDDIDEDGASDVITHTVTSPDPDYNAGQAPFIPSRFINASITDDDQAGIEISEDGPGTTVSEDGSTDEYEIVLTSRPTDSVEVVITPHAELDVGQGYGVPITITITPQQWDTAQEVTVSVEDDGTYEPDHPTLSITHTVISDDPKYDNLTVPDVDVEVEDDDDPPVITAEEISVVEGDAGDVVTATMTVTLNGLSTQQASVTYSTLNGTAEHGADYDQISPPQTLTWTAGNGDTKTIELTVYGDDIDEDDEEEFYVRFTDSQNAIVATSSYTVTITDDDDAPAISIEDVTIQEGDSGSQNATVTVEMDGMSNEDITVGYRTRSGSATPSDDYTGINWHSNNTVTWPAGQSGTRTFNVKIRGDKLDEGIAEEFYVELRIDSGTATLADSEGTVTILDDDWAEIDVTPAELTITEAMSETYELELSSKPALAVSVVITPDEQLDLGAGPGVAISHQIEPEQWDAPQVITVTVPDNSIAQGNQEVSIQHAATSTDPDYGSVEIPFSPSATSPITIVDDESPGLGMDLSDFDPPLVEGASDNIRLKLTSEPTATVTVTLSVNEQLDLGAGPGEPITRTFSAATWDTYKTVVVTAVADNLYDGGEHSADIVYELISEDGGYDDLPVVPLEVAIEDAESEPVLTASHVTSDEADGEATVTVTISGPSALTTSVDYTTGDDTATAPDDYETASGTLTWPAQDSDAKSFTVPIVDDDIDEFNETIDIEFSNVSNASMSATQRTITITDDDPTPSLSIADLSVQEGDAGTPNTAQITVTLSHPSSQQVTVEYGTNTGTAISSDFTITSGTKSWAPGEAGDKFIEVDILGDTTIENDEYFDVILHSPTNATISDNQGQVTIINDDGGALTNRGLVQLPPVEGKQPPGLAALGALFIAGLPLTRHRTRWRRWLPLALLAVALLAFQPPALAQGTPEVRVDHVETVEGSNALGLNIYFTVDVGSQSPVTAGDIDSATVLLDDGLPRDAALYPATVEKPPFYVALMVDTSGSMGGTLNVTRQAALELIDAAPPEVSFAVLGFDESIDLIQPFTTDRQQVAAALESIEISNRGTCLYDAAYAAVQSLEQLSRDAPRRALVLFSDGRDEPGGGQCSQNNTEQLTGLFQAREVPVPVNAVALSGGGVPDTATLERIANASGGQMATRTTLPDFIESMSTNMSSQWLARTELYPEQGYRRGALLLSLADSGPLPPGALAFRALRSYEPPAQGEPALIRDFAYNELTGNFLFNVALADHRQVGRLDVTVTDILNNVQVMSKSQEVILPTEQISLEASPLEPERRYLVQVMPYTPGGQPLREGGDPVVAQHRFRYELPPSARQLQFAIDSVRVKDEPPTFELRSFRVLDDVAELIATLQLANAHDLVQVEGYLVAEEENRQVAEFVSEVLPNGTVRLPLQVDGGAYRVVLRGLDEDGAPLAADETVFTFRPRQNVLQRAATALRQNPVLLPLALLPLALGLAAGWIPGRMVGRREGRRVVPEGTPRAVATTAPGPVQLRVAESPDESLHSTGPWLLNRPSFTIGRQGSDLTISGDLHVSRNHARITRDDGRDGARYFIEDLGSSNGTFVEGVRLVAHQPTLLDVQQETHVRIGKTTQLVVGQRPMPATTQPEESGAANDARQEMEPALVRGANGNEHATEAS